MLVFSCEFGKISKNIFYKKHLWAVTYMCAYFSEGQPSEAGKQAAKEAFQ